jgi:hypothetical protein
MRLRLSVAASGRLAVNAVDAGQELVEEVHSVALLVLRGVAIRAG